jgi:nucleotidyltransferase substrate binding protein (TIGR01987 family)
MAKNKSIRWKQRFQNFEKAFLLLEKNISIESPTEIERAGIIQFFEMAFELAWKLMKDYLESQGFIIKSPREAIKLAFQTDLVEDGQVWLDALEDRNLTVHTYDEETALEVINKIKEAYYPALQQLYKTLSDEKNKEESRPEEEGC